MVTLGYDIGSSSIKAALYDVDKGKEKGRSTYPKNEMEIVSPYPGWAEQDPNKWWEAVILATKELLLKTDTKPANIRSS